MQKGIENNMKCKCDEIMITLRERHPFDACLLCKNCGRTVTINGEFYKWTAPIKKGNNE